MEETKKDSYNNSNEHKTPDEHNTHHESENSHDHHTHYESENSHDHPTHHTTHPNLHHSTKPVKYNVWMISTVILAVAVIVLMVLLYTGGVLSSGGVGITGEEAGIRLADFLNLRTGGGVEYEGFEDKGNIYEVTVNYQGQSIPVYITKDGEYFVQGAVLLDDAPPRSNDPPSNLNTNIPISVVDVDVDDDAIKGDKNAPVTIIEFGDYECPLCGRYFTQIYPQIIEEYVDTGKVKIVFRDFPLGFHQNAQKAAEAAECAGEQEKYYEMHDKLFENQNALDEDSLKEYAKDLKLDTEEFDECLDSGEMASEVLKDFEDGQDAGVSGTPVFFINGKMITGAQPFENFKQIIDEELSK